MKKCLLFALLLPLALSAQNDSTDEHKGKLIKFSSVSAYIGTDFYRDGFEDRTTFRQAAPSSAMPYADLTGYSNSGGATYFGGNMAVSNGINVQFRLRPMPRYSELRFGVSHSELNVSSLYYYKQSTTRIDTISMSNGDMLFVDSMSNASYRYDWRSDVINLHAAFLVHSDARRIFNFYTGFGLFGGIGFNGVIEMEQLNYSYQRTYSGQPANISYSGNHTSDVLVQEHYKAPVFGSFGAYIPIGVNMRLGRRNPVLSHLALFGEYTGAVQFFLPQGVDPKVRTSSSMYGGVRWYIHSPGGEHKRHQRRHEDYKRGDGMVH